MRLLRLWTSLEFRVQCFRVQLVSALSTRVNTNTNDFGVSSTWHSNISTCDKHILYANIKVRSNYDSLQHARPFFSTKTQYWYHLISFDIFKKLVCWFQDIHQSAAVWGAQESSVIGKTIHSRKPSSYCSPWLSQLQAWQGKLLIHHWTLLKITENPYWHMILIIFPLSFFFLSSCFSYFQMNKTKKRSAFSVLSEVPTSRRRVMWSSYIPCWLPTRIVPWAMRCRWIRPRFSPPDILTFLTFFFGGVSFLWDMKKKTNKYNRISTDKSC